MQITDLPKNVAHKVIEVESGCWEWQGSSSSSGYGDLHYEGQHWLVHRFVYTCTKGEIPSGLIIWHTCDNRKCCNPAHLNLGTHQQNVLDKEMKGRGNAGERNGIFTLTRADVETIRLKVIQGVRQIRLAEEYGVNRSCISKIINGTHWK